MLTGIDKDETFPYVASGDEGATKTIFHIGNITNREKIALVGEVMDAEGKVNIKAIQDRAVDIFIKGVKKIENLFDKKTGKETTIDVIDEALAEKINFLVLCEVAGKVVEFNFVGEDERKN